MVPIYEPRLTWRTRWAAWRQLQSGWIGPGKTVADFAERLGVRFGRHCTVVGSGTQALMLAYWALDLKPGSVILCPDYGLPACQNAARLLGHYVQLVDVSPSTGCVNPDKLREHLEDGTKSVPSAVVFVNHNGYAGEDLQRIATLCKLHGIPLIEDSAVALGCPNAGRTGIISTLSFSVPKLITTGQGGAVFTADDRIAERLRQLVDQGGGNWRQDCLHIAVGGNFRMTDLQAAIGNAQLDDLSNRLARRDRLWDWYRERIELGNDIQPSGWMVTTRAQDREHSAAIMLSVQGAGFECKRLYRPVHHNTPYVSAYGDADYPGAAELYDRLLYLPSSLNLTRRQVDRVCDAVEDA